MTIRILSLSLLVAAASTGCVQSLAKPSAYATGDGGRYCGRLAAAAEKEASTWSVLGWTTGVVGVAGVVSGAAMGPDESEGASWAERNRGVLVTVAGSLVVALATSLLSSSDAASTASGSATRQLAGRDDRAAFDECAALHGSWIDARRDANQVLRDELDRQRQKAEAEKPAP